MISDDCCPWTLFGFGLARAGKPVAIDIAGTGPHNLYGPEANPIAAITFFFGGDIGSRLDLPVDDASKRPSDRILPHAFAGQDPGFAFG